MQDPHNKPIKHVVIAGGGTAGWLAASLMKKVLGKAVDITLVESEAIGTVGVGEATIPPIRLVNQVLGIDEAQFLHDTKATIKLAIRFENWKTKGESYYHTFGAPGKALGQGQFRWQVIKFDAVDLLDIAEQGIALYQMDGLRLKEPCHLPVRERAIRGVAEFIRWQKRGTGFLAGAAFYRDRGDAPMAALMLHQACEHFYLSVLRSISLHAPRTHALDELIPQRLPLLVLVPRQHHVINKQQHPQLRLPQCFHKEAWVCGAGLEAPLPQ
mgnify:CR=1 FL=1